MVTDLNTLADLFFAKFVPGAPPEPLGCVSAQICVDASTAPASMEDAPSATPADLFSGKLR